MLVRNREKYSKKKMPCGEVEARLTEECRNHLRLHFAEGVIDELAKKIYVRGELDSKSFRIPLQFEAKDGSCTADLAEAIIQCNHINSDEFAGDPEDNPYSSEANNLVYIFVGKPMTVKEAAIAEHGWDSHDDSYFVQTMDRLAFRLRTEFGLDIRSIYDAFEWLINNDEFFKVWMLENKGGEFKGFRSVYFTETDYLRAKEKDDALVAEESALHSACTGNYDAVESARIAKLEAATTRYEARKSARKKAGKELSKKMDILNSLSSEQLDSILAILKEEK